MLPTPLSRTQAHHIRQLKAKKYRSKAQAFVVEGKKSVHDLLSADYTTEMIVGTPDFLAAEKERLSAHTFPIYSADPESLARMSSLKKNHHVIAVATMKPNHPLSLCSGERALVLDTIKDPGNLGTIMRIADWYGIKKMICSPTTVDRYNAKVIQASMGSFTQVQSYYTALAPFLKNTSLPIIGAVVQSQHYLPTTSLPQEGLLVIGNESQGIHPTLRPLLTLQVAIKPQGHADSLNAAIATAIICEHWCNVALP